MMDVTRPVSGVENLAHFRQLVTLADGLRVCLRPLVAADRDALVDLFQSLSADDLQYFRSNVTDPELVARWAEAVDYTRVFPLVAVVGDQLVGTCTLHLGSGPTRHIAEIRVFLTQPFRRRGIGTAMLKTQIELARKMGLHQLIAEIIESRPQVAHAFEHLGFQRECVLRDHFMTPTGETLDLIVMVRYLKRAAEEF
jgi:RimJ/RimL family protein N-acetyltransferase